MALILVRPLYRIHYHGRKNLPKGAFILASDHISYFDPLSLGMGIRRRIFFMAKSELFTAHGSFAAGFLRACGVFPVKRLSADKQSADKALMHLARGRIVGIFPQGGIVRGKREFSPKAGAALLAARAGVPLVPVHISAPKGIAPFRRIDITAGEPLYAEDGSLRAARRLNERYIAAMRIISEESK